MYEIALFRCVIMNTIVLLTRFFGVVKIKKEIGNSMYSITLFCTLCACDTCTVCVYSVQVVSYGTTADNDSTRDERTLTYTV